MLVLVLLAAMGAHALTIGQGVGELRTVVAQRLPVAVVVTAIFAVVAARLKFVTIGGAVAGSVISVMIFVFAGAPGFVALATVFVLALVATRIGYARKQRLGMHEHPGGRRAMQVLANLSVAAGVSAIAVILGMPWLFICMAAALAEAAADTVSSECGEAWSSRVYLVTTFERVAVGTDGGISAVGTLAGVFASAVIVWIFYAGHLIPRHGAVLAGGVAVIGTFVDSLLGATLERRGWFTNNVVNFLSTLAAAGLAAALVNL